MDFDSLKNTVSNLTLYDLKAGVRKVQNAVMNYTEMEAKVREATNNEPWGASSTLMNEIASGTYNYQLLNEIMPMIYKRFTEKAAEEWRQIYKALQLLEFLIKNGSERVIDDARSHISLLKMLRQFHFIDQNGKDQGLNVRNRSKELAELLSDVERIRAERKKARATKNKYGGVEGGAGLGGGFTSSGGSRYGGFGSEEASYGGYSGQVYGDGGGFGGNQSGFSDTQQRRDRFEEYDEYDEGAATSSSRRKETSTTSSSTRREEKKPEPPKPKAPEVDLFSFDEPAAPAPASSGKQPAASDDFGDFNSGGADDDDFDDFQGAPAPVAAPATSKPSSFAIPPPTTTSTTSSNTQFAAPQPRSGVQGTSINDLFSSISPAPSNSTPAAATSAFSPPPQAQAYKSAAPTAYQASQPNYFTSVPLGQSSAAPASSTPGSVLSPASGISSPAATTKKVGGDAFSSLLSGTSLGKTNTPSGQKGLTMADMAKQKASAGMWGAPAGASSTAAPKKTGSAFDDLI